jgi:hypothetical protein
MNFPKASEVWGRNEGWFRKHCFAVSSRPNFAGVEPYYRARRRETQGKWDANVRIGRFVGPSPGFGVI